MKPVWTLTLCFGFAMGAAHAADRSAPMDLSGVRGFNYQPAWSNGVGDFLLNYRPKDTELDLDLARRLNLNQARVFFGYNAYLDDKEAFRKNILHLVRACHERGIGLMPVINYNPGVWTNPASWPEADAYAAFLVQTLAGEPGLAFWDVANEPDNRKKPGELKQRVEFLRHIAGVFRKLDPKTPVTIGWASEPAMELLVDEVDVLCYHDYKSTRAQIRDNIARARACAAKAGKPLLCTEIGCVGRANPYDVALQEYMNAGVGWYIWELMITRNWGTVHGVFYADGTVRDPAIVAALMGCFRNRGPDAAPARPDDEGRVTRTVSDIRKWLEQTDADWAAGLDLAESAANLLEAGELVAMREPPSRRVELLRQGEPDRPALRALLEQFAAALEPHRIPPQSRRQRPAAPKGAPAKPL